MEIVGNLDHSAACVFFGGSNTPEALFQIII